MIALGNEFLKAFSRIPKQAQGKVRNAITDLQMNPSHPGLNFEPVHSSDENLYSIRIDRNYRGILLRRAEQSVYVLLWVDKHDDAYDWASRRRCLIHPETGALQVVQDVHQDAPIEPAPPVEQDLKGLFDEVKDREMRKLGVPEQLLPKIRSICDESQLDLLASELPEEVAEALYMLASGYTIQEAFSELNKNDSDNAPVASEDFKTALGHPDAMRRFHVVADAHELQSILNAPLEQWRVFLHPSQRRIVNMQARGPVRVLGGAGTGKTVVAIHRTKWLLENIYRKSEDRILFITFTTNLTADIEQNLSRILSSDDMKRVEVVNLDAWVRAFLKGRGYQSKIVYDKGTREIWEKALNLKPVDPALPDSFFQEEWNEVVQSQGIDSESQYLRCPRIGRGRKLDRRVRKAVWPVFAEYRALLSSKDFREPQDAYRDASALLQSSPHMLPYKSLVVDEAQDFGPEAFRLFRTIIPSGDGEDAGNDLFIVGDTRQRIYGRKVVLGQCGIEIRGRSRRLRINYRTTEETRSWASCLMEGRDFDDLDGGVDDQRGYRSLMNGPAPEIIGFKNLTEESDHLVSTIRKLLHEGCDQSAICVVARTEKVLSQYRKPISQAGLDTFVIRRTDSRSQPGVRLATMHRVKGVEFDHIFIVGAEEGVIPNAHVMKGCDNDTSRLAKELGERSLLYVAATRAKKSVHLTYSGRPCSFLRV